MAKYRMIAIDLDGTLLSPSSEVTPASKAAIHKALSAGFLICFATGRNWTESKTILEAVEHYSTAVFVGGAMVFDTKKQITLHRTMMAPQLAREVCKIIEDAGHAVLVLQDHGTAGTDYLIHDDAPLNEATREWLRVTEASVQRIRVPLLSEYDHAHTIRIGTVAAPSDIATVRNTLEDRLGERIFCHSLKVPFHDLDVMEIFDPSVNKWEGILHVARLHEIDPADIIAIGDNINDLAMIQNAGLGVAMGNATPEIKAIAKRVIGSNQEEGLAKFLEELVAEHLVEPMKEN